MIFTYLASPYSGEKYQREARTLAAEQWYAECLRRVYAAYCKEEWPRRTLYSTITMTGRASEINDQKMDYKFWMEQDRPYLLNSRELWVLKLPSWENSYSIGYEIHMAHVLNIPIQYFEPSEAVMKVYNDRCSLHYDVPTGE